MWTFLKWKSIFFYYISIKIAKFNLGPWNAAKAKEPVPEEEVFSFFFFFFSKLTEANRFRNTHNEQLFAMKK